MENSTIGPTVEAQREYYEKGGTRDLKFRKEQLKKLYAMIRNNEDKIMDALHKDLRKSRFESYAGEIGVVYMELSHTIKHLKKWAGPKRAGTPIIHFLSFSKVYSDPYGVTLIIGPWNYPFQLTIAPLIGAMAAGNTAILKPSELSPHTSGLMARLIKETFDPRYVTVVEGGVPETQALLEEKFDYIFFTGGTVVGKIIMEAAARQLTPLTLELGGKSPTIVDEDADLRLAAKRILWGKLFNAGQTCLAPDYLLVHKKVKEQFIEEMKRVIIETLGEEPSQSPDYARIINDRHFDRLISLMHEGTIVHGGKIDKSDRYIEPTLVENVDHSHKVMKVEIFGPIFPVMEFNDISEVPALVKKLPRPLALYYFSKNKRKQKWVLENIQSGGACINDTVSHVGSQDLPFGGIGDSGMGNYHGKSSFDTFSHQRGVLTRSNLIDLPLRYGPYKDKVNLLKKLFRIIA